MFLFLSIAQFKSSYQKAAFKSHNDWLSYSIIRLTSRGSINVDF